MRSARMLVAVVLASALGWTGGLSALASPPSVTLSGYASDGYTPESLRDQVSVSATLNGATASGSLSSERGGGYYDRGVQFEGSVTCMALDGREIVVGAFGHAKGTEGALPGTYAQVLTLEYGKFRNRYANVRESFGLLGEDDEGEQSDEAPNCATYSFSNQFLNTGGGSPQTVYISMSPTITSPEDGYVSHTGAVKLRGTGEAGQKIKLYEVGHESSGVEVKVNQNGQWKRRVRGLSPGKHVFGASTVNLGKAPSNTVEVIVD